MKTSSDEAPHSDPVHAFTWAEAAEESTVVDTLINIVFHALHTGLIAFHLFALLVPRLRVIHFWSLTTTLLSWLGLGLFYGLGYCPLTDWHWQHLIKMGTDPSSLPRSYVTFIIFYGREWPADELIVDILVGLVTAMLWLLSLRFFIRRFNETRRPAAE